MVRRDRSPRPPQRRCSLSLRKWCVAFGSRFRRAQAAVKEAPQKNALMLLRGLFCLHLACSFKKSSTFSLRTLSLQGSNAPTAALPQQLLDPFRCTFTTFEEWRNRMGPRGTLPGGGTNIKNNITKKKKCSSCLLVLSPQDVTSVLCHLTRFRQHQHVERLMHPHQPFCILKTAQWYVRRIMFQQLRMKHVW